jgi:hypothetical protein
MKYPHSLQAEQLMAHMQILCKQIGPRPSTSPQERQAAEYVRKTLQKLGVKNIQEQPFKSQDSLGWITIPTLLAGALAAPVAWLGGRWGKLAGGLLLLGGVYTYREFFLARPPFFQRLIARGNSQNVIAHIPPAGSLKRKVFLVGHLDTNKQRFNAPPPNPGLMKPSLTLVLIPTALSGVSLLADFLRKRRGVAWWHWLINRALLVGVLSALRDEAQPHIEGANDNATAVSVLLGIAEALQAQPLQHTGVTLLFTGCEEVVCVGMENYLQRFAPPRQGSYWIDLEMVGTGNLCYVTRHGISHLSEYYPTAEMVSLAAQTARQHPELGVTGKDMLILEEVANLRHRGYNAICLAGYDESGFLPNWHRLSDNLENIEPDTLSRAARYTWALIQEIDNEVGNA